MQFVLCILFVSEKSQFAQNSSGVGANINIYVMKCCPKYKQNVPKTYDVAILISYKERACGWFFVEILERTHP